MRSFLNFLLHVVCVAAALWFVVKLIPGLSITPTAGGSEAGAFVTVAVVFVVVNTFIAPVLRLFGAPITCLTLGLFSLVINGAVLYLTAWLLQSLDLGRGELHISNWWAAIFGAIALAIVSSIINAVTSPLRAAAR